MELDVLKLPLRGSVPASLVQLDALERFFTPGMFFVGEFPPQILQLPNISSVAIALTALTLKLPASIGPNLVHLFVPRNETIPSYIFFSI